MSRRIKRPENKISKQAADSVSSVRRAAISDAITKNADVQESVFYGSIANSPSFKKNSLEKISSIISPIAQPTTSTHTDRMGPEIYSPLFQIANLNLPRDRITMNAWNRIFYDTHPIVRNAINLHASFPISKINITCESKKVLQFFNEMAEKIDLYSVVYGAALEFWKLGEVFCYGELDESNGTWSRINILNPDYVHVKKNVIGNQTLISLRPDASLTRLINSSSPSDLSLKRYIPKHIVNYVKKGQNIPLDNFNVSHLKLLSSPYDIRGTSIVVSVYKDLMLYDKLRESKFAQADGMVNPLTLVKLGGNDYRPSQSDIEAFKHILEEAQYDKDFKLVTHADVTVERVGYSGGVLDITGDMEKILNNLYAGLMVPKALMDQEGACVPVSNTEILVEGKGFVFFDDLEDDDKIATVNPETLNLEFHKPTFKKDYDFSGLMYSVKNEMNDFECTDFHEMFLSRDGGNTYSKERMLSVFDKDEVLSEGFFRANYKNNVRFLNHTKGFVGSDLKEIIIEDKEQYSNNKFFRKINVTEFCEFLGYYLSEGHLKIRPRNNKPCGIEITQQPYSKGFDRMEKFFETFSYKTTIVGEKNNRRGWYIGNTKLAEFVLKNFGNKSEGKYIANFVKNLSVENLKVLIEAMNLGDGSILKTSSSKSFKYSTISKKLSDDFQEICFKSGYATRVVKENRSGNRSDLYKITVYKRSQSKKGSLRRYSSIVKPNDVSVKYVENVRVFCVEVPNHVFVTRKNGHIAIHGNTYASSSVGLEVLRQRYDIFRNMMKKWIERKVFAPICELQDFFEYKDGRKRLLVPSIDFNHMNLYDMNDYVQGIGQFVTNKQVSLQTLHRSLGLSYEEERRQLKEEAVNDAIFAKEQQILGNMRLSELSNVDPNVGISEPPETVQGAGQEGGGEGGGLPGVGGPPGGGADGGGGGLL